MTERERKGRGVEMGKGGGKGRRGEERTGSRGEGGEFRVRSFCLSTSNTSFSSLHNQPTASHPDISKTPLFT